VEVLFFIEDVKNKTLKLFVDLWSSVWEPQVQGEKFPAKVFNSLWNPRATGAKYEYLINPAPGVLPTA